MRLAALAALLAGPAFGQSYEDHERLVIFTQEPCGAVIAAVDGDGFDLNAGMEEITEMVAAMGATWGIILGYDTAKGGLHSENQTTLERLRDECAANPEKTAQEILDGF